MDGRMDGWMEGGRKGGREMEGEGGCAGREGGRGMEKGKEIQTKKERGEVRRSGVYACQ